MNREFNRQQKRQENERDPKAKSRLMIASGVVFLIFALWMMLSTKHYTSLEFPIASKDITISMEEKSVTLSEEDAVRFSRRMQNSVRTREHDETVETLFIKLGTGVTMTLDPDKNAGTIEFQGVKKPVRVSKKLMTEALRYLEEEPKKE